MSKPLDLIRQTQAQNRLQYAEGQERRQKFNANQSQQCRYEGRNADTGQATVSNGNDSINVNAVNTNGWMKPGQSVKFNQAGSRNAIDSMPRPKPKEDSVSATVRGKIKVLFAVQEDESVSLYVGGWKSSPVKIASYSNQTILRATVNNLGGDRWIASWLVVKDDLVIDCVVKTNSGGWTLKELHPKADLRLLFHMETSGSQIRNLGFGLWQTHRQERLTETTPFDITETGSFGYWYKDQLKTEDYTRRIYSTPYAEQPYNATHLLTTGKTYVLPEQAEDWSEVGEELDPGNSGENLVRTYSNQHTQAILVNSNLSQAYGYRARRSYQFVNGVGSESINESGTYLFQKAGPEMLLPGLFDSSQARPTGFDSASYLNLERDNYLTGFNTNWVDEKPYRIPIFLDDGTTINFAFDEVDKFKQTQTLTVQELEFGAFEPIGVGQRRSFQEKVYSLKSGLDRSNTTILGISYHP